MNRGFTLAETLITLVIIGVVAALTVPSLINKTNNQEYVSRLKKEYSTFSQVTQKIISDEGPVTSWATSTENIYKLYRKYLNNAKDCNSSTGCFDQPFKYMYSNNRDTWWDTDSSYRRFILTDGTTVMIVSGTPDCTLTGMSTGSKNVCSFIFVDVNGKKAPNNVGKDIFLFCLKKQGLYPCGCDEDNYCTNEYTGYACACKVIRENAINY